MNKKITVIGAGSVGATIAYTLAVQGLASDIVLIEQGISKISEIPQATERIAKNCDAIFISNDNMALKKRLVFVSFVYLISVISVGATATYYCFLLYIAENLIYFTLYFLITK